MAIAASGLAGFQDPGGTPYVLRLGVDASLGGDFTVLVPLGRDAVILQMGVYVVTTFVPATGAQATANWGVTPNGTEISSQSMGGIKSAVYQPAANYSYTYDGQVYFSYVANGATAGKAFIFIEYLRITIA